MPKDETSKERKRMVVEEVSQIPPQEDNTSQVQQVQPIVPEPIEIPTPVPVVSETVGDYSNPTVGVEKTSNVTWILIPGIMLLGALLGGIIFYQNKVSNVEEPAPTPTATITASEVTPTPTTVSEDVDLEKYTINLQNGSGITGEASKVKGILEKAGFKVGTTGNASKYDYTSSIIQAKSTVDASFISKLKEILGETYKVGKDEVMKATDKSDVVIIIGSTKN